MAIKQDIGKQEDGKAVIFYVLALSHTPALVVMWTDDRRLAEQMRDDYERMHGGEVVITTK